MAIKIPSSLIDFILLGPLDDRRQLQDSPILADVLVEFGRVPDKRLELLIAPYRGQSAGTVAGVIDGQLEPVDDPGDADPNIASLQGVIVASLTFDELMLVVAPKTKWWIRQRTESEDFHTPDETRKVIGDILRSAIDWDQKNDVLPTQIGPFKRILSLTTLILWARNADPEQASSTSQDPTKSVLEEATAKIEDLVRTLLDLRDRMAKNSTKDPLVWQVSLNRRAMPAISRSIPAVKADAATTLFKVNCSEITWAVIDSGIDGSHPAFLDKKGKSRVIKSFDFRNLRRIVSLSNRNPTIREKNINLLRGAEGFRKHEIDFDKANEDLEILAEAARVEGPVRWDLVEKYITIDTDTPTPTNHGTHVAGIIGASKESVLEVATQKLVVAGQMKESEQVKKECEQVIEGIKANTDLSDGMCPDIKLYDFRVLGATSRDTEFAICGALQFIRYLNSRDKFLEIHGANLSISIPHDVRNFACGRTPICDECEKLVSSGVVVVAAAGNHGYKSFATNDGAYDSYAAFSVTDPGNADSVLTVGSTHRFWPHTYGVSFFSSRGPTGDGRMKPDLVAPGERIRSSVPGDNLKGGVWGDLDGTSMAAPHVSGAAAMLMARYSEMVGQPLRIKQILCDSATDLGRERSFQGHGMLDVLRAFQSI